MFKQRYIYIKKNYTFQLQQAKDVITKTLCEMVYEAKNVKLKIKEMDRNKLNVNVLRYYLISPQIKKFSDFNIIRAHIRNNIFNHDYSLIKMAL